MGRAVEELRDEIGYYMDEILRRFKPGAKITVLVRREENDECDFTQTNDTDDGINGIVARRCNPHGADKYRTALKNLCREVSIEAHTTGHEDRCSCDMCGALRKARLVLGISK